jgi:hypothetical protein
MAPYSCFKVVNFTATFNAEFGAAVEFNFSKNQSNDNQIETAKCYYLHFSLKIFKITANNKNCFIILKQKSYTGL